MSEEKQESGFGDEFKKVESRKRKSDKMEEERPYFAPISAEKMTSNKKASPDIRTGLYSMLLATYQSLFSSSATK